MRKTANMRRRKDFHLKPASVSKENCDPKSNEFCHLIGVHIFDSNRQIRRRLSPGQVQENNPPQPSAFVCNEML
jgi:hypothetical protein